MAPGLPEAREKLNLDKLSKSELEAYYRHLYNVVILRDNINTECAEGRAEGRAEEKREMALRMKIGRYSYGSNSPMQWIADRRY